MNRSAIIKWPVNFLPSSVNGALESSEICLVQFSADLEVAPLPPAPAVSMMDLSGTSNLTNLCETTNRNEDDYELIRLRIRREILI
jgi:hypothetical protein